MVEKIVPLSPRTEREPLVLPVLNRRALVADVACGTSLLQHPETKRDSVADPAAAGDEIVRWPPHGEPMLAFNLGQALLEKQATGKGRAKSADPCSGLGDVIDDLTQAENGCSVLRLMTPLRVGGGRMQTFTVEVEVARRDAARTPSGDLDPNHVWRRAVGFAALL